MAIPRRKRKDKNHNEIVNSLKLLGIGVTDLSSVGGDVPDIIIHYQNLNIPIEIKSKGYGPTEGQKQYVRTKNGYICYSIEDVLLAIYDYWMKFYV